TERRLGDGRRCIKPLCIDTHTAAPPSTTATTISKAPSPPRPTTISTSVAVPSSNLSSVRPMPTIPIDPKPTKGVIRSSTSSITLPSSI
ncbi:unnamed protein product, partial [Rotaria magnacalcarata]